MRNIAHLLKSSLASVALVAGVLAPVNAATSDVLWVDAPTWSNLHVKNEDGVFERARREFDTSSNLVTSSETQHNAAWVRSDRRSVTVQYLGGLAMAGRKVKFLLTGDVPFTDSIEGDENIAITDEAGKAEVTLTLNQNSVDEDSLQVGLSSGEGEAATTIGNMAITWQSAGFFPIIKLVGSGQGFESRCTYRTAPIADGGVGHAHECTNGDFAEYTWAWSVFKREWLPEYSQVYVKSYKYGSTINLVYKVTDIWGTPIEGKSIYLIVDQGCRLCRWGDFESDKETDNLGYVSFSVPNRNTSSSVKNNTFINSDTKVKESGFIAFSIQPTTNELDESADFIWPQLVTDVNIKGTASRLSVISRGSHSVNGNGDYITTIEGVSVTNPPLQLDTTDAALADINVVNLSITFLKNSMLKNVYSPEVKVEADNGGKAALIDTFRPLSDLADSSKFKAPLVFSYTYAQQIALMCTKAGTTTFKIYTGVEYKTFAMDCKNSASDARNISPVVTDPAVPGQLAKSTFKVTDRWGNPVQGVSVSFSTSGIGEISGSTTKVSDENGLVSADITSSSAGDQSVTARVTSSGNQTGQAANVDKGIIAGNAEVSQTITWGTPGLSMAVVGRTLTLTFFNQQGKKASYYDGTKRTYITMSASESLKTVYKTLTKGRHVLRLVLSPLSRSLTVTVK